jgi:hypothetical protein
VLEKGDLELVNQWAFQGKRSFMASLLASTIPSALSVCYEIDEFLNLHLKLAVLKCL